MVLAQQRMEHRFPLIAKNDRMLPLIRDAAQPPANRTGQLLVVTNQPRVSRKMEKRALIPAGNRFQHGPKGHRKYFRGSPFFAQDVGVVGLRGSQKLECPSSPHQRQDADHLAPFEHYDGTESVVVTKGMPPSPGPRRSLKYFRPRIRSPQAFPLWPELLEPMEIGDNFAALHRPMITHHMGISNHV